LFFGRFPITKNIAGTPILKPAMIILKEPPGTLDTGHFFHISPAQGLFFKAYPKVKNPKIGSFLRAQEDFEGFRSRKEKIIKTPSFFGQKIK
jgi:hypothetical protein